MIFQGARVDDETYILNMGPQHPSTHGVLRIILKMDGEYILDAEPVLGYAHRMHEKMAENRTYIQYLPNLARLDYLSALLYNHGYVMAVEKLIGISPPPRAEYLRVIMVELNRISSHLLWLGAFLLDLGAFTPFLYAFEDREHILDILERVTGSRLTYCYFRFGGLYNDVDDRFTDSTRAFVGRMRDRIPMYHDLVTDNIIFRKRVEGIGVIDKETALKYGATGPVLRGTGIPYDIRRHEPYSVYPEIDFEIPTGENGDALDRYMVRVREIEQSLRIVEQALDMLPHGPIMIERPPKRIKPEEGEIYFAVETARGEFGMYIVSDGSPKPYRLKLRVPSYSNLSLFPEVSRGVLIADAVAILGSLDLVIPEIDR